MALGKIPLSGKDWSSLKIGERWEETRTVTVRDIFLYLGLSDELNPLYLEENYVAQTEYKHLIVPSGLLVSWLSSLVSMRLPGPGSVVKELRLSFPHVLKQAETIKLSLELIHKSEEQQMVTFKANITQNGKLMAEGEVDVFPPRPLRSLLNDTYENF